MCVSVSAGIWERKRSPLCAWHLIDDTDRVDKFAYVIFLIIAHFGNFMVVRGKSFLLDGNHPFQDIYNVYI